MYRFAALLFTAAKSVEFDHVGQRQKTSINLIRASIISSLLFGYFLREPRHVMRDRFFLTALLASKQRHSYGDS